MKASVKCKVAGCDKQQRSHGYCSKHLSQILRHGRLTPELERNKELPCVVSNCGRRAGISGYCEKHQRHIRNHGALIDPKYERMRLHSPKCKVLTCGEVYYGRGYCKKHYMEYTEQANSRCTATNCTNAARNRGYCSTHYAEYKRHGRILLAKERKIKNKGRTCSADSCVRGAIRLGLCSTHLRRRAKIRAVEYSGGHCAYCGYDKCLDALTFHHIDDGKKKFTIGLRLLNSKDELKAELDKCLLLCHN